MMKSREELVQNIEKVYSEYLNQTKRSIFSMLADLVESEIKEDRKKTVNLLNRETILEANFTCSCNGFLAKAISKLQKHWEDDDEKV